MDQPSTPQSTPYGGGILDSAAVSQRWEALGKSLKALMEWMDSQETWIQENGDDKLVEALTALIELSGKEGAEKHFQSLDVASSLSQLLAWVDASRFFRFLEIMDERMPNFVNRLVMSLGRLGGERAVFADLFFERVTVVHKSELMTKLFDSNRAASISRTLQTIRETRNV